MTEVLGETASTVVSAVAMLFFYVLGTALLTSAFAGRRRLPRAIQLSPGFYETGTGRMRSLVISLTTVMTVLSQVIVVGILWAGPTNDIERTFLVGELAFAAAWSAYLSIYLLRHPERPY